ncbi:hypothetical protein DY000_02001376 [Brassica cretica]|uniref:Fatty acid desaturase N-terminal domain-containing protein n=1 Tax=Brassica cretica TaxID=69181 RepID=A0ABQ7C847_BRACR|nr:hypothetical protein DY000_02001376 [Brassica cretica]
MDDFHPDDLQVSRLQPDDLQVSRLQPDDLQGFLRWIVGYVLVVPADAVVKLCIFALIWQSLYGLKFFLLQCSDARWHG